MDDNSYRRSNVEDTSCTTNSMYLSFDAESTISSACYKTMEAMADISSMSALSIDDHGDDKHVNSTLENQDSQVLSPLKTVKKMDVLTVGSPVRALPKNIMREYKALSSTPSREQLIKNVDVTRGSDPSRCIDLGVAFLGVEDEKPAYFPLAHKPNMRHEENKENTIPDSTEITAMSVSSSIDIATSLCEKRYNSVSTTGSLTGDESEAAISVIEKRPLNSVSDNGSIISEKSLNDINVNVNHEDNGQTTPKAKMDNHILDVEMMENCAVVDVGDTVDFTPKIDVGGYAQIDIIPEDDENRAVLTPKLLVLNETKQKLPKKDITTQPRIAVLKTQTVRRSVCEPNLQTNKPSRISTTGYKRQSLLPVTNKKTTASEEAETEIPLLMNKMLKIASTTDCSVKLENNNMSDMSAKKTLKATANRSSLMPPSKTRTSLMPTAVGDKRPYSFKHRMSVVVKTTLNSPARKIARKSVLGLTNSLAPTKKRNPLSTKSTQTNSMQTEDSKIRRSMIPNSNKPSAATMKLTSLKEMPTTQQRKSMYPIQKKESDDVQTKTEFPSALVRQKLEPLSFTCTLCKEKFRIKSLLDAHKRTHEGDVCTPIVRKTQSSAGGPNTYNNIENKYITPIVRKTQSCAGLQNIENQCKYCDKKFALVRALHIHLLQNCSKIPPAEKRKLEYTEMNHVEKARLPSVFHHSGTSSNIGSTQATPRGFVKPSGIMQFPKTIEKIKENDSKKTPPDASVNKTECLQSNANAAGSSQKAKISSAHSGVYRTPSKAVPCHICKLTFKSILDYTNHSLSTHGSKTQREDVQKMCN